MAEPPLQVELGPVRTEPAWVTYLKALVVRGEMTNRFVGNATRWLMLAVVVLCFAAVAVRYVVAELPVNALAGLDPELAANIQDRALIVAAVLAVALFALVLTPRRLAPGVIFWMRIASATLTIVTLLVFCQQALNENYERLQESYVWLNGASFMIAAAYVLLTDGHVRVDVIYRTASPAYKAFVDAAGGLLFLLPFAVLIAFYSSGYVLDSIGRLEQSPGTRGLPGLWVLKTCLWVFCYLLFIQGISLIGRCVLQLTGWAPPKSETEAVEVA